MIVSKTKYEKVVKDLEEQLEINKEFQTKYDQLFQSVKQIVEVCQLWNKDRCGNLRAINSIAALFNLDKSQKKYK
jgi:hypothetical protein